MGTNRGLYLEELSFFCQHWGWTQGLRGEKRSGQGPYNGYVWYTANDYHLGGTTVGWETISSCTQSKESPLSKHTSRTIRWLITTLATRGFLHFFTSKEQWLINSVNLLERWVSPLPTLGLSSQCCCCSEHESVPWGEEMLHLACRAPHQITQHCTPWPSF